jgi:hypothetical protein
MWVEARQSRRWKKKWESEVGNGSEKWKVEVGSGNSKWKQDVEAGSGSTKWKQVENAGNCNRSESRKRK